MNFPAGLKGNRRVILYLLIALIGGWMLYDHFRRIKPITGTSLIKLLNVHASPTKALRVDGTIYKPVAGESPYYLAIPKIDSIFFQTEGHLSSTYHIYNLRERKDVEFKGQFDRLGDGINASSSHGSTVIEDSSDTNVIILHVDRGERRRFRLNLLTKVVD